MTTYAGDGVSELRACFNSLVPNGDCRMNSSLSVTSICRRNWSRINIIDAITVLFAVAIAVAGATFILLD